MLKIQNGPDTVKIWFRHPDQDTVVANLSVVGQTLPPLEAIAKRNPSDPPNRAIGRKVALEHLLKFFQHNKTFRTEVWNAYWQKVKRPH